MGLRRKRQQRTLGSAVGLFCPQSPVVPPPLYARQLIGTSPFGSYIIGSDGGDPGS